MATGSGKDHKAEGCQKFHNPLFSASCWPSGLYQEGAWMVFVEI
jgi:hypothetical protein